MADPPAPKPSPERKESNGTLARVNLLLAATLVLGIGASLLRAPRTPPDSPGDSEVAGRATQGAFPANLDGARSGARAGEAVGLPSTGSGSVAGSEPLDGCDAFRADLARGGGAETRRGLGACLARLGREAYQGERAGQAVHWYREAVAADPDQPEWWSALAAAHLKAGEPAEAERALGQALARFPDDAEGLYRLAELRERQGRTQEAVEILRRLLGLHPGHARGRALLARLDREQAVEGGYWAHESPHFLVRYEGAQGIDLGRSVVDSLEEAYESIGRDLGAYPPDRLQVGIYAAPVFGAVIGAPPHLIAGAYDGRKVRLNLAASAAYSSNLSRLVRHEYAHAVIHVATRGRAPIWLHEGLAQVLEPRAAPRLLPVSVPREYLSLAGIERLSRTGSAEALVAGYSLTHIAVEYLVDQGGMAGVRTLLGRLGQGDPLPEALRAAFGIAPADVEARLAAAAGRS